MLGTPTEPLRVVVVGPSVGYFIRPPRNHPLEGNYPELLGRSLREAGHSAEVVNSAGWFLLVHEAFQDIEDLVLRHSPHVVVTNFGMGECQPKVIPTALLRWMYSWRPAGSRLSVAVRRLALQPLNRAYVRLSPPLIRRLPHVPHRVSPARFEYEIRRFVSTTRKDRQALVLMLSTTPAGETLESILPGTDERARRYDQIMAAVAAEHAPDVRVIDVRALVAEHGDDVSPDGIHFSARGHGLVAARLQHEVELWLKNLPPPPEEKQQAASGQ